MTVEPMTDVDRIRAQWITDLRDAVAASKHDKHMQVSPLSLACLFKALDEANATISTLTAERDQHANAYIDLHGQHVAKMLELADARAALKRVEAERDAAVARVAWRPIETAPHATLVLLYCPDRGPSNPKRIELGYASHGSRNAVSSSLGQHAWATMWMPLPDLPTPTATGDDNG